MEDHRQQEPHAFGEPHPGFLDVQIHCKEDNDGDA
jgi:hypothetical protein